MIEIIGSHCVSVFKKRLYESTLLPKLQFDIASRVTYFSWDNVQLIIKAIFLSGSVA